MSANNYPRMQVRQGVSGGFRGRSRSAVSALALMAGLVTATSVAAQGVDLDLINAGKQKITKWL